MNSKTRNYGTLHVSTRRCSNTTSLDGITVSKLELLCMIQHGPTDAVVTLNVGRVQRATPRVHHTHLTPASRDDCRSLETFDTRFLSWLQAPSQRGFLQRTEAVEELSIRANQARLVQAITTLSLLLHSFCVIFLKK